MALGLIILLAAAGLAILGGILYVVFRMRKAAGVKRELHEKAAQEFIAEASVFSGLYEPLYRMGQGKLIFRPGIIGDWVVRMQNLQSTPHFNELWFKTLSGFTEWDATKGTRTILSLLSFLFSAGLKRDSAEKVIIADNTYKQYATIDGELLDAGSSAIVRMPYWSRGEKIIEKGIIEKA
jgi:hypothetical protein